MLGHIYRLVRGFEQEHGIHPNLIYLNLEHIEYLKAAFDARYSLQQIMSMLHMEMIIDHSIVHPHVAWTHTAQRMAS